MRNYLLLPILALTAITGRAQTTDVPTLADLEGDYVIINSKSYEDVTSVSEVRNMTITPAGDDSVVVSGFYMRGSVDFKAAYSTATGNLTIPAGTKVFGYADGMGSVQYLYNWDDTENDVSLRPVIYRYQGNGVWQCSAMTVLRTTESGSTSYTDYIFAQGSKIARANAKTANVTYDGDAVRFDEERPSYVELADDHLTVYNLLQKDSYGYGCWVTFDCDKAGGPATANPQLIGSATSIDWPYKALTGCTYDESTHRPGGPANEGTNSEGTIEGTLSINGSEGTLTLNPLAVWPAKYDESGWTLNYDSFYEVEESVVVTFDVDKAITAGLPAVITPQSHGQVVGTARYDLTGRRLATAESGQLVIEQTRYSDGTTTSRKVFAK